MGLLMRLLQETRREAHIRSMASILGCFVGCYSSAFAVVRSGAVAPFIDVALVRVVQLATILVERVVAAVPAECVDDDVARAFISMVAFAPVDPSLVSQFYESTGRFRHRPPPNPTQDPICELLPYMLRESVTFNDQYIRTMMNDTDLIMPVCASPCISCFSCTVAITIHNTLPLLVCLCGALFTSCST